MFNDSLKHYAPWQLCCGRSITAGTRLELTSAPLQLAEKLMPGVQVHMFLECQWNCIWRRTCAMSRRGMSWQWCRGSKHLTNSALPISFQNTALQNTDKQTNRLELHQNGVCLDTLTFNLTLMGCPQKPRNVSESMTAVLARSLLQPKLRRIPGHHMLGVRRCSSEVNALRSLRLSDPCMLSQARVKTQSWIRTAAADGPRSSLDWCCPAFKLQLRSSSALLGARRPVPPEGATRPRNWDRN